MINVIIGLEIVFSCRIIEMYIGWKVKDVFTTLFSERKIRRQMKHVSLLMLVKKIHPEDY